VIISSGILVKRLRYRISSCSPGKLLRAVTMSISTPIQPKANCYILSSNRRRKSSRIQPKPVSLQNMAEPSIWIPPPRSCVKGKLKIMLNIHGRVKLSKAAKRLRLGQSTLKMVNDEYCVVIQF